MSSTLTQTSALTARLTRLSLTLACGLGFILGSLGDAEARKPGVTGERQIASGQFDEAVRLLEAESLKGADEWYLLGQAYMNLGRKEDAYKAWTEAVLINKKASKRKKWTFLFPPNKNLKAKQKTKLKEDFEDDYRDLSGAVTRMKELKKRDLKNEASRTRIEAKRKDAKEEQLTKVADAKSKTISDKQRVADRRARSAQRSRNQTRRVPVQPPRKGGTWFGLLIVGLVIGFVFLALVAIVRRGRGGGVVVYHDDDMYDRGPFYYEGHYFTSQDMFYDRYGYHYTNRMFREYGGQHRGRGRGGYDEHMDHEIMEDIHEREELYTEAAQQGYEADMMRADADHLDQDAHEIDQELGDADDALSAFDEDEDHAFSDDEDYGDDDDGGDDGYASADDEFEDDPEA